MADPHPPKDRQPLPGKVALARSLLFAGGGVVGLLGLLTLISVIGDPDSAAEIAGVPASTVGAVATLYTVFGAVGIVLAARFRTGGKVYRLGGIAWSGLGILVGILTFPLGLLVTLAAVVALFLLSGSEAGDWFTRAGDR
ncbi:hypothetical protein PJ985_05885 [Streptomyces sp. ACA25]|uniref:hypothetical protein n=1 Tax=Streptomyces sp. ACA25 TaxID=3022596 RepID=UPI0023073494|nr:hypothetical protein [Streptomyces sp. ACA25]MDB1087096.1 hypothetical protein [Streptomyces sp. ACA25]